MSLRLNFPDPRAHREEELTLARTNSQRTDAASMPSSLRLSTNPAPSSTEASLASSQPAPNSNPNRRRVVLPDPVAFRFLQDEPSVTVVQQNHVLPGYELYLVEQWVCSRLSPAVVIVTFTGDPRHSVVVGVLEVPVHEEDWSPRLRVYFKAIQKYHARPKETEIGELMVTNLSSFPSALTVIAVPDGDIRRHRQVFIVNQDLKRMGCSGRSALTLTEPTPATQAKFLQLYKTSERIPFFQAVTELVKLCQVALCIFGLLEQEYIDGLLCDRTETAIGNWWTKVGSEYFNIEPSDGILGPTTVAALLGTLMGARNRLSYYGAPVTKDVFDIEMTKRGIYTFQKSQKLERTRCLDRQTLLKLHSATAKAAAGDGGWGVQKAVKSTVAEIGGKRGEFVIGMVGGRDKANIGDIETLDLATFVNLAYGERAKWLWHGKPRRTPQDQDEHGHSSMAHFGKDIKEDSPALPGRRTMSYPPEDELEAKKREESPATPLQSVGSAPATSDPPGDRDALRKTVFKSVAGKVSDARSGLGRIRDAVGGGLRGHVSRPSKDETPGTGMTGHSTPSISALAHTSAALSSPIATGRVFTWSAKPEEYASQLRKGDLTQATAAGADDDASTGAREPYQGHTERGDGWVEAQLADLGKDVRSNTVSVAGSVLGDGDLQGPILALERNQEGHMVYLQRRHSIASLASLRHCLNDARYPRRLSFGEAEEAVLRWDEILDLEPTPSAAATGTEPRDSLLTAAALRAQAELAHSLYKQLHTMQDDLAPWVTGKLRGVEALDEFFGAQQKELVELYQTVSDAYYRLRHNSDELVGEERARLTEAVKDVEVMAAKLEYELGALASKVREVEDGITQFEAQVEDVERRIEELRGVLDTESWAHWLVRTLTGIGTGRNITRGPSRRES